MAGKPVTPTDEFVKGLWRDNPVFVHMLGLCPALAVSNTAMNALAMGAATTFVLVMAGLSVSLLRHFIPREARIVCYICIIATFVTSVDYLIMALSLELHRALGADDAHNTDEQMIANLTEDDDAGYWIKASVEPGATSFTVTNARNQYAQTYQIK